MKHPKLLATLFSGVLIASIPPVFAGEVVSATNSTTSTDAISSNLSKWWQGDSATANWFGIAYPLKDYGLTIEGKAKEVFLGQVTPAAQAASANARSKPTGEKNIPVDNWSTEVKLNFIYDFGKVFGLNGLSVESDWRYRNVDGNPDCGYTATATGTSGVFNPNKDTSGMGVRIMSQFLQYSTDPKSKDPQFLVKAGWINPYEDFLTQPESKNFENNAIASAKGIGGNAYGYTAGYNKKNNPYPVTAVPWGSTYDSWGGMLRAKPTAFTYLQSYLGLAIAGYAGTQATPTSGGNYNNHGFNFQGTAAFNPNDKNQQGKYAYGQNGIYNVNEFGWTPKLGEAKLEGRYAIGNYIWGQNNNDFGSHSGNATISGLYLQADQRLTAVRTSAPAAPFLSKNPIDSKNPVPAAPASYDNTRGLYTFNEFTYTPAANNTLPFYFQTGLVYKGLLDARPADKTGVALGEGFYSMNQNNTLTKAAGNNGAAGQYKSQYYSTTAVIEYFYDFAINKWLDFVPDAQYIINPTGNGSTGNAAILGFTIAAKF